MIYFDNAATSFPKPASVIKAAAEAAARLGNPGRSGYSLSVEAEEAVFETRLAVSRFFGYGASERVVFTQNATSALNMAVGAFYRRGDHVLISNREHNASARPVYRLAAQHELSYDVFGVEGDVLANLAEACRPETRLVIVTQASNVTGEVLPLAEIAAWCEKTQKILIIDGAQGAGHIPLRLDGLPFGAYCASGHKGLLGTAGCGFCIFGNAEPERDFVSGGTGSASFSHTMPDHLPDRYEAGTLPTPAICSLRAGIEEHDRHPEKQEALAKMTRLLHSEAGGWPHLRILSEPNNPCGIFSFSVDRGQKTVLEKLEKEGFCLRAGFHCAPLAHEALGTAEDGCIRASPGWYNTPREVNRFLEVLEGALSDLS